MVELLFISLEVADLLARTAVRAFKLFMLYGLSSIPLLLFGSRATWRIEAQVIGQLKEEDAMTFKKSILDECTMIAVAAAIVAQIAITGLSLDSLSQTHWVARGAFVLSLTTSLMAVYYATTQQRMLGRLLQAEQVRLWIRGGRRIMDTGRLVPSLGEIAQKISNKFERQSMIGEQTRAEHQAQLEARLPRTEDARPSDQRDLIFLEKFYYYSNLLLGPLARFMIYTAVGIRLDFIPSDPDDFNPTERDRRNFKRSIISQCFTPSAASVITVSAPQMLLTTSLCSLLIGFGIYFGFRWTKSLDQTAGLNDSRNVFITYITSLVISILVYSISQLFQDDDKRPELAIMEGYLKEYAENNPEIVNKWGVRAEIVEGVLNFHSIEAQSYRGTSSETEQNPQENGSLYSLGIELGNLPAVERSASAEIVKGVEAQSSRGTTS
ncbi:hypothetical protein V499_05402 [Pseudogymnoascus sp. VKM F-103]|uniref:Uncharacterized protein n=1 Tax=Pseudogymnoascus verrucosus TaxID=342668 RepID=A0A1B8G8V3_9PEZI|nr:uncharacterized protein VE01_09514 [Pseudogymnoascus verrucosus]KFY74581.1 hypothetical protein V499_05402 [Pseudogymnoascus sp. VKM F-103]OBT92258.2 hypothetical protein VE01_09514 [Pseudogymnoascus verrucosus]